MAQVEELRKLIHIDERKMDDYKFKIASNMDEFYDALKLVQEVYSQEGYINEEESSRQCRILKHHFFDNTAVFIGKKKQKLVFSMSLFPDSSHGLPMDTIYKEELNCLRRQGRRIGEVGCLATDPEYRDGSQNIPMYGNKIMLKYAMDYLKLDDLVITVHPKHALVYKKTLMFDEIGPGKIKAHPKVNNNPAVALRLNLHEAEAKVHHFYGNNPPETNLHHFFFVKDSDILHFPENDQPTPQSINRLSVADLPAIQKEPVLLRPWADIRFEKKEDPRIPVVFPITKSL
ncbi:N-acyl amino acid synthase FeeM domain-containing protein [Desulfospira joergensenii]|uniref:N-acyl amino acid synthase FeeM domain-containing protein n=1 Tax=Desulfospira joergensenii TaxID=53329 RepID=UPI0003B3B302|nr:hypothetical protein [Desulfospira joergensenii]